MGQYYHLYAENPYTDELFKVYSPYGMMKLAEAWNDGPFLAALIDKIHEDFNEVRIALIGDYFNGMDYGDDFIKRAIERAWVGNEIEIKDSEVKKYENRPILIKIEFEDEDGSPAVIYANDTSFPLLFAPYTQDTGGGDLYVDNQFRGCLAGWPVKLTVAIGVEP